MAFSDAQIRAFRLKARAKGFTDAQINQEIARKQQEDQLLSQRRANVSEQPEVLPSRTTAPVARTQPTQQPRTVGSTVRDIAGAIVKPGVEFAKFVGEAGAQAGRYATDPTFRKAIQNPESLTQDEIQKVNQRQTYFVKPEQISNRAKIAETGVRRTAGAASYAIPGGTGVTGAIKAGAAAGALSAFSEDEAGIEDVTTGALTGGALSGLFSLSAKALRSQAAKRVGSYLKDKGDDIQLSTYTKNLGKPTRTEGGRELLKRMKEVGIRASDPDSVVDQANRIISDDGSLVYEATRRLSRDKGVKVPVKNITSALRKEIASAKSSVTKKPLQEVLDIIVSDVGEKGTISLEDLYLLKTEYGGLGRWTSLSSAVEKKQAEVWRDVYMKMNDILDDKLRANGFSEFRDINNRLHTAMQASQYAARSGNVAPNKYNIGLYDWMAGLSGFAAAGNPAGAIAGFGAKRAMESPVTANVLGNILQRAGSLTSRIKLPAGQIPQAAMNAGIVGAANLVTGVEPQTDETNYGSGEYSGEYSQDESFDLEDTTGLETTQHPIFGDKTKRDVMLDAFKSGLNQSQLKEIEALYDQFAPEDAIVSEGDMSIANDLRKEYIAETKSNNFREITNAYKKVLNAPDTAAGDVSLVFAYMKMLDPTSVVREGEFATAENTAGIPERIVNAYNKALSGKRLGSDQRAGFQDAAGAVYEGYASSQDAIDRQYEDLARRYGIDPTLLGIGTISIPEAKPNVKKNEVGSNKQSSNPASDLISSAGEFLSKITPTASASDDKQITDIRVEGDNVITEYSDGGTKSENIDFGLSLTQRIGKIFNDVGKSRGLPELKLSELLGYKSKEERINKLMEYRDEILGAAEKPQDKQNVKTFESKPAPIYRIKKVAPETSEQGVKKTVPLVEKALRESKIYSPETLAYALATIEHETAGAFEPVNEGWFNDKKFGYEPGFTGKSEAKKRKYQGGENYYGRGLIQLTHLDNYKSIGKEIGVDLVKNPEKANDPEIAAKILATYFKRRGVDKLLKQGKVVEARRLINPDDKGEMLSKTYSKYLEALK